MADVHGWVAHGWEAVREAFAVNIEAGREIVASFAAYQRGRKVVDLWAGVARLRTGTAWREGTTAL